MTMSSSSSVPEPHVPTAGSTSAKTSPGGGLRRVNISRRWANWAIFLKGLFKDTTEDRRASAYFSLHHDHDISNARFELGWEPRTYAQGIREVAKASDWWKFDEKGVRLVN